MDNIKKENCSLLKFYVEHNNEFESYHKDVLENNFVYKKCSLIKSSVLSKLFPNEDIKFGEDNTLTYLTELSKYEDIFDYLTSSDKIMVPSLPIFKYNDKIRSISDIKINSFSFFKEMINSLNENAKLAVYAIDVINSELNESEFIIRCTLINDKEETNEKHHLHHLHKLNKIIEDEIIVLHRWENLGLLEGLNDEAKLIVAYAFNEAAKIFYYNELKVKKDVETLSFPIIRKILTTNDIYLNFTTETVQELVRDILNKLISTRKQDFFGETKEECQSVEFDANFCRVFAENYVKDNIIIEDKKIIERWETLGLLEGLNDEAKLIVAHAFQELGSIKLRTNDFVFALSLPVTKQILKTNDNYTNFTIETVQLLVRDILTKLNSTYNSDFNLIKEQCNMNNIDDFEAEFGQIFAEKYIKDNIK